MNGLTLRLENAPDTDLDLDGFLPAQLRGHSLDQIRRRRVRCGRRMVATGDLFSVAGMTDTEHLRIENATARLHRVGTGLDGGVLEVTGTVGHEAGRDMSGGRLVIRGHAGAHVGVGMSGGLIDITGSAGDAVGGALPGGMSGMRDGVIRLGRHAGARVGERMRRGLILVEGDCGSHCGARMTAGTIVVLGRAGTATGTGMRRGTLLLFSQPRSIPATFNDCGNFDLVFCALLIRYLAGVRTGLRRKLGQIGGVRRIVGDIANGGQGEILIASAGA